MYNKLSKSYKQKLIYNFEEEPPEKKLKSEGDLLIKQLAEKQRNTKVNLDEQLSSQSHFYKSTEEVSLTKYLSGSTSLEEFNTILQHSNDVEQLKSCGLTSQEIELLCDYRKGNVHMKHRHKNINDSVLEEQLQGIFSKLKKVPNEPDRQVRSDRLMNESLSSEKPNSVETKLLKFALENQQNAKTTLPSAMNDIRSIEKKLMDDLSPVDIKKIRKKARSLSKQIEVCNPPLVEPTKRLPNASLAVRTKWDLKEHKDDEKPKEIKMFTCKTQNYYTIRDGKIIKISGPDEQKSNDECVKHKLTVEEIRKMPKFENYEKGIPSRTLYLKNLPNKVEENDLKNLLGEFAESLTSINIMKGKMRGQAFVEFQNEETASKVLDQCNGLFLKNKPIIIQFGKIKP